MKYIVMKKLKKNQIKKQVYRFKNLKRKYSQYNLVWIYLVITYLVRCRKIKKVQYIIYQIVIIIQNYNYNSNNKVIMKIKKNNKHQI